MNQEEVTEVLEAIGLEAVDVSSIVDTTAIIDEAVEFYNSGVEFHSHLVTKYRNVDTGKFLYHRSKVIEYLAKKAVYIMEN